MLEILDAVIIATATLIANLVGGGMVYFSSKSIENKRIEKEKENLSNQMFGAAYVIGHFFQDILEDDSIRIFEMLAEEDFYIKIIEKNIENMQHLDPIKSMVILEIYRDLYIIKHLSKDLHHAISSGETEETDSYECRDEIQSLSRRIESLIEYIDIHTNVIAQERGWESLTQKDLEDMGFNIDNLEKEGHQDHSLKR